MGPVRLARTSTTRLLTRCCAMSVVSFLGSVRQPESPFPFQNTSHHYRAHSAEHLGAGTSHR